MTVEQLIEKLRTLNPTDEVLIEVDHDEIIDLKGDRIEEDIVTEDHRLADPQDSNVKRIVLIRL